ncbi:MAG: DegT/DnrJ/EryC1/StrS family aminotransferase [Planctomycetes bacterium]|nr:DegT/DnrJ/EryC1/StrS family aminotransferase [Planctomycetota bacterium]
MNPFHDLRAAVLARREELLASVARVFDRGTYILGPEVRAFEDEFARACGVAHCIGVGSATEALQVAFLALRIGAGDEIVVPALTAAPTAMAVVAVGARPVFADVDPVHFTMTSDSLRACLTERTRIVVPVHLYGQCADVDALAAVMKGTGIPLLEDAAQAHGARDRGRLAGSMGVAAAFSFYPTKNLGAIGDGGALTTNDATLAERMRRLRTYGLVDGYDVVEPGINARLDELHAAMLRVRLAHLEADNAQRRAHAARYHGEVTNPRITLPRERDGAHHVWHQFVVRCEQRDALRAHLAQRGIETLIHYPRALSRMTAFEPLMVGRPRPVEAERAVGEILSLPIYPEMPRSSQDAVIAALNAY